MLVFFAGLPVRKKREGDFYLMDPPSSRSKFALLDMEVMGHI